MRQVQIGHLSLRQHSGHIHIYYGCITIITHCGNDHPDPACLHRELVGCSEWMEPEGVDCETDYYGTFTLLLQRK